MAGPVTNAVSDYGIEPAILDLTYKGTWIEGGPWLSHAFRVWEFIDASGMHYRYTQKAVGGTSMFSGILRWLDVGDPVRVRARFGCCSQSYRKSPHHENDNWLEVATHFLRPAMISAPRERAAAMYPFERRRVWEWT